jgi:hypothetical protein
MIDSMEKRGLVRGFEVAHSVVIVRFRVFRVGPWELAELLPNEGKVRSSKPLGRPKYLDGSLTARFCSSNPSPGVNDFSFETLLDGTQLFSRCVTSTGCVTIVTASANQRGIGLFWASPRKNSLELVLRSTFG